MKKTKRQRKRKTSSPLQRLREVLRHRQIRVVAGVALAVSLLATLVLLVNIAAGALRDRVNGMIVSRSPEPRIELVDIPDPLRSFAEADLRELFDRTMQQMSWMDPTTCGTLATALAGVPWVDRVQRVSRHAGGVFAFSAAYRLPFAVVDWSGRFYLIDRMGVRLPGVFADESGWYVIHGVAEAPPSLGEPWPGPDLQGGLDVLGLIVREPFADQIASVLVDNFGGRRYAMTSHIELLTRGFSSHIRWGSAPGTEVEENTPAQKLRLLRASFERTGRVADHPFVDVSVYPDRLAVGG